MEQISLLRVIILNAYIHSKLPKHFGFREIHSENSVVGMWLCAYLCNMIDV